MNDVLNPIKSIRLFHVFDAGRTMNVYQFRNPWITDLSADEVTMEGGVNHGSITFMYDSVYVDLNVPLDSMLYNLTSTTQTNAMYPLQDISGTTQPSVSQQPNIPTPIITSSPLNTIATSASATAPTTTPSTSPDLTQINGQFGDPSVIAQIRAAHTAIANQ
jgi:hypothetical protein